MVNMNLAGLREILGNLESFDRFWTGSYYSQNDAKLNFYAR